MPQSETQKPLDTIEKSEAAEVRSQEEKPKARTTGRKPRAYKRKPRRDTAEVREPEKQAASTNKPDKEPQ